MRDVKNIRLVDEFENRYHSGARITGNQIQNMILDYTYEFATRKGDLYGHVADDHLFAKNEQELIQKRHGNGVFSDSLSVDDLRDLVEDGVPYAEKKKFRKLADAIAYQLNRLGDADKTFKAIVRFDCRKEIGVMKTWAGSHPTSHIECVFLVRNHAIEHAFDPDVDNPEWEIYPAWLSFESFYPCWMNKPLGWEICEA